MNEEKAVTKSFDLSQNPFVIFITSYAPGVIIGCIIITTIKSFLPDRLSQFLYALLFIAMIIKAIMSLQLNKRILVISEKSIMLFLKKRKNKILLTKINNDDVESISQIDEEAFLIKKNNGQKELIHLSCFLKPYKILLYGVKSALFEFFGAERTNFDNDSLLQEYRNKKSIPEQILKADDESKIKRLILVVIYVIIAGLPTILGILAIMIFILLLLIGFLKGIMNFM